MTTIKCRLCGEFDCFFSKDFIQIKPLRAVYETYIYTYGDCNFEEHYKVIDDNLIYQTLIHKNIMCGQDFIKNQVDIKDNTLYYSTKNLYSFLMINRY